MNRTHTEELNIASGFATCLVTPYRNRGHQFIFERHAPPLQQEEVVLCGWLSLLQRRTFLSLPFFFVSAVRAAAVCFLKEASEKLKP